MKFGTIPVQQAEGKIFAHNIAGADGRNAFRKGRTITGEDIHSLAQLGYQSVYAAELEASDIDENRAARLVAQTAIGGGLRIQGHSEGRVNLVAEQRGLLRVDEAQLEQVNQSDGISFATLRTFSLVEAGQSVATVKIIPYGISAAQLDQTLRIALAAPPLIQVKPFSARRVGVVYAGSAAARERVMKSFGPALRHQVAALESRIEVETYVPWQGFQDEMTLASALLQQVEQGIQLVLVASETSTMDPEDVIPCAVRIAGGQVTSVGAPIEPGNLVMLAYLGEVPLLNVPGCIRSPQPSLVNQILAALLAGERLSRTDIIHMGHGGLMESNRHGK